jgi:hypothetical protein
MKPVYRGKIECSIRNSVQISLSDKPVLRIKRSALSYKLTFCDIPQTYFQIFI